MPAGQSKPPAARRARWSLPIVAACIACLDTAALFALLAYYNGRVPPSWPANINLNSLSTFLARVAEALISYSATSSIVQLCYLYFSSGLPQPLGAFDLRYRGAQGGVGSARLLIYQMRRRPEWISLGALVMVWYATNTTFVQQAIGSAAREITAGRASAFIAQSYNQTAPGYVEVGNVALPMVVAIYTGLLGSKVKIISALQHCPTSEATWEPFVTLGVGSMCRDITNTILKSCSIDAGTMTCYPTLPHGGPGLIGPESASNLTASVYFDQNSLFDNVNIPQRFLTVQTIVKDYSRAENASAMECILYANTQKMQAKFNNGTYTERQVSEWFNKTAKYPNNDVHPNELAYFRLAPSTEDNSEVYTLTYNATTAIQNYVISLFGGSEEIGAHTDIFSNDISRFVSDSIKAKTLPDTMSQIALAMTLEIRREDPNNSVAFGRATEDQLYVLIHWAWLTVPGLLPVMALILVLGTYRLSQQRRVALFRSDAFTLLDVAPSDDSRLLVDNLHGAGQSLRDTANVCYFLLENERLVYVNDGPAFDELPSWTPPFPTGQGSGNGTFGPFTGLLNCFS